MTAGESAAITQHRIKGQLSEAEAAPTLRAGIANGNRFSQALDWLSGGAY